MKHFTYNHVISTPLFTRVAKHENIFSFLQRNDTNKRNYPFGTHGYDNSYRAMRPIFIAHGPNIRSKTRVPPFRQVDIYNLLAKLIGIRPGPNNGTWDNVSKLYNGSASRKSIILDAIRMFKKFFSSLISNQQEICI